MPKLRYWLPIGAVAGLLIGVATNSLVAQSPGVNSPFVPTWDIPLDSIKRTYSNVIQMSPGAFATDIYQVCGAAGIQTKISRIYVAARATAVSPTDMYLVKRSNWDTGGTVINAVSTNGVTYDSNQSASRAAVTAYSGVSPTLGTLVGVLAVAQAYVGNLTTGTSPAQWTFDFSNRSAKSPTLNAATDCLAVNLSGTSQGANLYDIWAEWTEEP